MSKLLRLSTVLFLIIGLAPGCRKNREENWIITAPAGDQYTAIDRDGRTVIPNGRFLTPLGRQIRVAPHPYGLTLSPDGTVAVTANSGIRPFSVSIIRDIFSETPSVEQIPPQVETDRGILAAVFMGLAVSPDNSILYVGGGQEGKVFLFDLTSGEKLGVIDCDASSGGHSYEDSYIGDLALTSDGRRLYAVDQTNFRMVAMDTETSKVIASIRVGRYPFGLALSPDENTAYVANVGMFEYSLIKGVDPDDPDRQGLKYPPFPYLSKEAEEGRKIDGYEVPGLGDPNVPESFSVWAVDIADPENARVTAKVKTGILVGQMVEDFPAVGGASPNSVIAAEDRVFVSNGNNDCITVIDTQDNTIIANISLQLDPRLGILRGIIPFGLALSPDGRRLYIAEAGINAVGVIDTATLEVLGHIPVCWFPSKIAVSRDGKRMAVANAKGFGSGPNGGPDFKPGPEGYYIGNLMKGTVSVLTSNDDDTLAELTQQEIANNFHFRRASSSDFRWRSDSPIPLYPQEKDSPIEHIVFIVKENRTFDEVFGGLPGVRGEPSLARYGAGVSFSNEEGTVKVDDATVMVNHLLLAEEFAIADNFNCDSDVSADGHCWLIGIYPNELVETNVAASYGGGRELKLDSTAPGMLASRHGYSGAPIPEDYTEAGTIWDHMARYGVEFFNFGLSIDFAPNIEKPEFKYIGLRFVINYPMPSPLYSRTSRRFATYNMGIPDQFRTAMFLEEFEDRWMGEEKSLPPVLVIYLGNDHGSYERPEAGYPFRESYMADNDLALGRVIEYLSHTPYWKSMAVFVTEDDAQDGVDHVDAHRSILMVISPYARRNYVGNGHYSFGSILKTFWHILGIPCLNQYDAGATDLADLFTDRPDFTPYQVRPVDPRIFDPEKALDPFDEAFDWEAVRKSPKLDDPETIQEWMKREDAKKKKDS